MKAPVKVVQYGLGPVGCSTARLVAEKKGLKLVGGVDIDEAKVGRDLGDVMGVKPLGIRVSRDLKTVLTKVKPDIVLHATQSFLKDARPQIEEIVEAGIDTISTSEELAYPHGENAPVARRLDGLCKKHGVTVLAAGVNPGFLMDALVVALTGVCQRVDGIVVTRVVDASTRRLPLQKKVGAGLTRREFDALAAEGRMGHVGMAESLTMIADALGVKLDEVRRSMKPVISRKRVKTEFLTVEPGRVAGVHQTVQGVRGGRPLITLDLQMYVGAEEPLDSILVEGVPPLHMILAGGVPGDIATAAIVVNSIPRVVKAPPGLLTVKDLPMAAAITSDARKLL